MTPNPNTENTLLVLNHEIREYDHSIEIAKRRAARSNVYLALGPFLGVGLYALFWIDNLPRDVLRAIYIPAIPLAAAFTIAAIFAKINPGAPAPRKSLKDPLRYLEVGDLELKVSQLRDQRTMLLAEREASTRVRRVAYKEDAFTEIDRLRKESNRYRRVNNILQAVLIIGSISATGITGIIGEHPELRWVTLGLTLTVGISSGFNGYFKYKERSFYLKQTADAIENEWEAVEIGVGRYRRADEDEALAEFVEEVHRLKSEQKKREQNLEQPAETRASTE